MRLSTKEANVLVAAELDTALPAKKLRKITGYREHTIRHALHKLERRGVIVKLPFVNLHRIGITVVNIFFNLGAQKRAGTSKVLNTLAAAPQVLWIGEFGGEYQYGIAVAVDQICQVAEFLREISLSSQVVFFEKAISTQYATTIYPRRYLSSKKAGANFLESRFTKERTIIDELDQRILRAAANPGAPSNREISQKLGVPHSTVDFRMRKIVERGVLGGTFYAVDCTSYGYQSYKIIVFAKGVSPALTAGIQKFCECHPNITYLIECLGTWDYEIGVELQQAQDLTIIQQELYEEFGAQINTVRTLAKFRDLKFRWFPG